MLSDLSLGFGALTASGGHRHPWALSREDSLFLLSLLTVHCVVLASSAPFLSESRVLHTVEWALTTLPRRKSAEMWAGLCDISLGRELAWNMQKLARID